MISPLKFFPRSGNVNIAPGVSPGDCVAPALKDPKGRLISVYSTVPSALNRICHTSPRANARGYIRNPLRGIVACLLLILACPSKKAEPEISPSFDKSTSTLTVQVKLPAGKHAYAPGEPIGQPIALRIEPDNNWVLATPIELPKGDSKHLLNDNFKIKAKVKNGRGPISAILHMQLCTAEACERPKDYAFQVSL